MTQNFDELTLETPEQVAARLSGEPLVESIGEQAVENRDNVGAADDAGQFEQATLAALAEANDLAVPTLEEKTEIAQIAQELQVVATNENAIKGAETSQGASKVEGLEIERQKLGVRMYEVLKSGRFAYGDKVRIDGSVKGLLIYDADEYETRMDAMRRNYETLQEKIANAGREVSDALATMTMSKIGSTPTFNRDFAIKLVDKLVDNGVVEKFDGSGGGGYMNSEITNAISFCLDKAQLQNTEKVDLVEWIKRAVAFPLTESFRNRNNLGISFNTRDLAALGNATKETLYEEFNRKCGNGQGGFELIGFLLEDDAIVKSGQPVSLEKLERYVTRN